MVNIKRYLYFALLFGLLVLVRGYVAPLFYDPLNVYFKYAYLTSPVPTFDYGLYFLHLFLRYFINSAISLMMLWVVFKDINVIKFAIKFYVFAFVLLSFLLLLILRFNLSEGYILLFYIRRFLIHPLFVVVLIPAFYYQKLILKAKELQN